MTAQSVHELLRVDTFANGQRSATALVSAKPGDVLCSYDGVREERNRYTVQVSETEHLLVEPEELRFINHGCDPNVIFDVERMTLRALRDIAPGDELVYFYPATEWSMAEPFDCFCKSDACLTRIQGAKHLTPEVRAKYELSPHILAQLEKIG
jgi:hypothetical protein